MIADAPKAHELILLGGGHSHLSVLKYFAMHPIAGLSVTLVNKNIMSGYSGMMPGYIAGKYNENEIQINLANLCQYANARLIPQEVIGLDTNNQIIKLKNKRNIKYDTLSINIGGEQSLNEINGAKRFAHSIKPISNLINQINLLKNYFSDMENAEIVIIGGGAGGIEIALSINNFISSFQKIKNKNITIICRNKNLIPNHNHLTQYNLKQYLIKQNIKFITDDSVIKIMKNKVLTEKGLSIKSNLNLLVTSISPAKWLSSSKLNLTDDGFIKINHYLQTNEYHNIFAAGDISSIENHNLPKAGVYAVRQGPVLAKNLHSHILKKHLIKYKPQTTFLSLIGNGKDFAIASWWKLSISGKLVWVLKDFIDRSFIKKFTNLPKMKNLNRSLPNPSLISEENIGDPNMSDMKCLGCGSKTTWEALNLAIQKNKTPSSLVNINSDASVIKVKKGLEIVQSVDLISAIVNDPYELSRISLLHAISDLIASAATPYSTEAIFILPPAIEKIQSRVISELLEGIQSTLADHKMKLTGGHTIEGKELQVGFAVTGFRNHNFKFNGPVIGDNLILTKKLGIGSILAGQMRQLANHKDYLKALKIMNESNKWAGEIFIRNNVSSMTDITGFGLARHALNLANPYGININFNSLPILSGAIELIHKGINSSLADSNRRAVNFSFIKKNDPKNIFFDPQTSGGLLASISDQNLDKTISSLKKNNINHAVIGKITKSPKFVIS